MNYYKGNIEKNLEGGGKTTYPICINIPYIRAIENNIDDNAREFLMMGTKVKIVF